MSKQKRLTADPVLKIRDVKTNAVVGWVYLWNNGDVRVMWREGTHGSVLHGPLSHDDNWNKRIVRPECGPHRSPRPEFG